MLFETHNDISSPIHPEPVHILLNHPPSVLSPLHTPFLARWAEEKLGRGVWKPWLRVVVFRYGEVLPEARPGEMVEEVRGEQGGVLVMINKAQRKLETRDVQ
jgi:hypothetical protein